MEVSGCLLVDVRVSLCDVDRRSTVMSSNCGGDGGSRSEVSLTGGRFDDDHRGLFNHSGTPFFFPIDRRFSSAVVAFVRKEIGSSTTTSVN